MIRYVISSSNSRSNSSGSSGSVVRTKTQIIDY